jgi:uncharacterized membrane protein (DUF2068 family)
MAENFDNRWSGTTDRHEKIDRGLEAIAIFKLVKGALLLIVGAGAAKLIHVDVYNLALQWIEVLHVDADNRYIHWLLRRLMFVDERTLRHLSGGTFVYAAVVITEGVGLLRQKVWAEFLTVIATAALIPLEIYELYKRFTALRLGVISVNVAVVWYLINLLRPKRSHRIDNSA